MAGLCRPVGALRVAWALLRLIDPMGEKPSGAVELLRRLPIICIEDGLPSALLPPLVWLMVRRVGRTRGLVCVWTGGG